MRKQRKHYTAEEKVAVPRRHLVDKVPLSKLCDELARQPRVSTAGRKNSLRTGPSPCRPRPATVVPPSKKAAHEGRNKPPSAGSRRIRWQDSGG